MLSRNFLVLLTVAAVIAIPVTWAFFTNIVLVNVAYHDPIGFTELFAGAFLVGAIALSLAIAQGLRIAKRNPVEALRSE
ncbi:MAG: hypothetical protein WDO15_18410 [Bacteroidota bacterium]